jgi:tripartite-type tricarboxylate transporter receptor subunit TctC
MGRARWIAACAAALVFLAFPAAAPAQDLPNRPIRIIVPYPAGGGTDVQARIVAEHMAAMGQPVVVENRSGASGVIGSEAVARSAPDGTTIVFGTSASHAVNAVVMKRLPYDPIKDFAPITLVATLPNGIIAAPSFPARTVPELVKYLKDHPGTSYGTSGPTSSGRFAGELLQAQLNVKMTLIPYKGGSQAAADVVAGHVPIGIFDIGGLAPMLLGGQVRAIAFTGTNRLAAYPDVPTVAEASGLKDFAAEAWVAAFAPAATPPAIVQKLNAAIRQALARPDVKQSIEKTGAVVRAGSPDELRAFIAAEIGKWGELARKNNIHVDN